MTLLKGLVDDPAELFKLDTFRVKPHLFNSFSQDLMATKYDPSPMHFLQRLLADKGLLAHVFTQNVDGLEFKAGVPEALVTQAHGGFGSAHCIDCAAGYPIEAWREPVEKKDTPRCSARGCHGLLKPRVVFYGEGLDPSTFVKANRHLPQTDLLVVAGTSLIVNPVASFTSRVAPGTQRVLMNRDRVGEGRFDFDKEDATDHFVGGECDHAAFHLVAAAGWQDEFAVLLETYGHRKASALFAAFCEAHADVYPRVDDEEGAAVAADKAQAPAAESAAAAAATAAVTPEAPAAAAGAVAAPAPNAPAGAASSAANAAAPAAAAGGKAEPAPAAPAGPEGS